MKLRAWVRYVRKALETWGLIAREYGWRESFMSKRPVDAQGQAIPWYTYPAIEFLRSLDLRGRRVFEFGCGNSSVFWAGRAQEVVAVENDIEWARTVNAYGIANLTVMEQPDMDLYVLAPDHAGGVFDVVVIDGRCRHACIPASLRVVSATGMVIFDNADWYPEACADLRAQGWFQIDFSGLGPINPYCWTTSVFVRCSADFARAANVKPVGGNPQ